MLLHRDGCKCDHFNVFLDCGYICLNMSGVKLFISNILLPVSPICFLCWGRWTRGVKTTTRNDTAWKKPWGRAEREILHHLYPANPIRVHRLVTAGTKLIPQPPPSSSTWGSAPGQPWQSCFSYINLDFLLFMKPDGLIAAVHHCSWSQSLKT